MHKLIVANGPDKGLVLELREGEPQILGRRDAPLPLMDTKVSRQHAEFFFDRGAWYVRDLGSRNGTLVNGELIDDAVCLRSGARVQVGQSVLVFGQFTQVETQGLVTAPLEPEPASIEAPAALAAAPPDRVRPSVQAEEAEEADQTSAPPPFKATRGNGAQGHPPAGSSQESPSQAIPAQDTQPSFAWPGADHTPDPLDDTAMDAPDEAEAQPASVPATALASVGTSSSHAGEEEIHPWPAAASVYPQDWPIEMANDDTPAPDDAREAWPQVAEHPWPETDEAPEPADEAEVIRVGQAVLDSLIPERPQSQASPPAEPDEVRAPAIPAAAALAPEAREAAADEPEAQEPVAAARQTPPPMPASVPRPQPPDEEDDFATAAAAARTDRAASPADVWGTRRRRKEDWTMAFKVVILLALTAIFIALVIQHGNSLREQAPQNQPVAAPAEPSPSPSPPPDAPRSAAQDQERTEQQVLESMQRHLRRDGQEGDPGR